MKVCFETYGCRLNRAEALDQEARYLAQGWTLTKRHDEADLIVVRGCSVTRRAEHDCEQLIEHLRRKYPNTRLLVQGCLRKRDPERNPDAIADAPVPTRTARAYLKVQDGCSGACTFCIVPQFRGASVSIPFGDVLVRARRLMEAGYREIVVTGCNLALYASEGKRLPELLAALAVCGEPYGCRIRLGSVEPGACANEVIRTMADHANVCRFLHLTVQSGSSRILRSMRRPYAVKDVEENLRLALDLVPSVGLGCDLMTGFPGEETMDHQMTVGLAKRYPFANAHIFPYSKRPGTLAAGSPLQVDRELRSRRAKELTHILNESRARFAARFNGLEVQMVVEDAEKLSGWSGEYLPVKATCRLSAAARPKRKDLVSVRITSVTGDTLHGNVVSSASPDQASS